MYAYVCDHSWLSFWCVVCQLMYHVCARVSDIVKHVGMYDCMYVPALILCAHVWYADDGWTGPVKIPVWLEFLQDQSIHHLRMRAHTREHVTRIWSDM